MFPGDGINADTIAPSNIAIGESWTAPLTLGHAHGSGGPAQLRLRSQIVNGASFTSPIGGRPAEFLITGAVLSVIAGTHDGEVGGIDAIDVPDDASLVGLPWAAQYTVVGGGFADLWQAVYGVIGCM